MSDDFQTHDLRVVYPQFHEAFPQIRGLGLATVFPADAPLPQSADVYLKFPAEFPFLAHGAPLPEGVQLPKPEHVDLSFVAAGYEGKLRTLHFVITDNLTVEGKIETEVGDISHGDNIIRNRKLYPDETKPEFHLYRNLEFAARDGHLDQVKQLLAQSAPLEWNDPIWTSPLELASWHGHFEIVQILLNHPGPKLHRRRIARSTELAVREGYFDVARLLLTEHPVAQIEEFQKQEIMYQACSDGKLESVRFLMEEFGFDVDYKVRDAGQTPLYVAVQEGKTELVKYLLGKGADPNCSVLGVSALQDARENRRTEIARLLEQHKAK